MSTKHLAQPCLCCDTPHDDRACRCIWEPDCEICRYCKLHCRCSFEMKAEVAKVRDIYEHALSDIRARHPENVNKRV